MVSKGEYLTNMETVFCQFVLLVLAAQFVDGAPGVANNVPAYPLLFSKVWSTEQ